MTDPQADVKTHNREVLMSLSIGDLVEFERGSFSHWAVYVGQEKVIHIAEVGNDGSNSGGVSTSSGLNKQVVIKRDDFWKVADKSKAKKNNANDEKWKKRNPEIIVKIAECLIDEVFDYNVLTSNCEHFVNLCRYGEWESDQVNTFVKSVTGAALIALSGLLLIPSSSQKKK